MSRKSFLTFREKATKVKFHENSRIKMLLEFKVANYWAGRKIRLKMCLIVKNLAIYYHKSKKM